jgi:hypothetical protein
MRTVGAYHSANVGVRSPSSPFGDNQILIENSTLGRSLVHLLGAGNGRSKLSDDQRYFVLAHDRFVDQNLVDLVDLLSGIRQESPFAVQLSIAGFSPEAGNA